ncbi:hypothetical protein JX265_008264 [Neoarthrinium moseri]|uniref:Uncharacterized protein n=1 Tax=Neoarthrinium moseri TaxID=1658444 RepID=A0A9Q0AKD0_9PEZI|nr:hypothetical protein JX265_008264 [Neoarthrinium moseri]
MRFSTLAAIAASGCAAVASAAAVQARQTPFLANIKGWAALSDCSTQSDLDFNVGNGTVDHCIKFPYAVSTVQLGAIVDGPYQVSFYTDSGCADLERGTTANVPGACQNNAIGPWLSAKVATF